MGTVNPLGHDVERIAGASTPHPAIDWATCGAMALTGSRNGPPVSRPARLATSMRGAGEALRLLAGNRWPHQLDTEALLGERETPTNVRELHRQGRW